MKTGKSPLTLAPKAGEPCPPEQIAKLEELLADAKSGVVGGFCFVAIGPDFVRWREGYVRGSSDRHNLMGQLLMAIRTIEDLELES